MTRTTMAPRRSAAAVWGVGQGVARPTPLASVERLLGRSDAELVAATFSAEPTERFLHAHLAALRAGAALVEAHAVASGPRRGRRGRPLSVWELVVAAEPALGRSASAFADAASLRAAVETGRRDVSDERADLALTAAEQFQDEVREILACGPVALSGTSRTLRAS